MAGKRLPNLFVEPKSCPWLDGWHLTPLHRLQTQVFSVTSEFPYLKYEEMGYTASRFLMRMGSNAHKMSARLPRETENLATEAKWQTNTLRRIERK